MPNQQIIQYIQQHIQQGHSETAIQDHLRNNGWTQVAIDQAFAGYHLAVSVAAPLPPAYQPLATTSYAPPVAAKSSLVRWLVVAVIAAFIVITGLSIHAINSSHSSKSAAQSALAQTAQNTARANDVNMIMAGIGSYTSSHSGNLPQTTSGDNVTNTLNLCGSSCAADQSVVKLDQYLPSDVAYHAYVAGLTAPDVNSVYIVNNATCNSANDGIGQPAPSGQVAAAVLYASKAGSGMQQKCVSL